MTSKGKVSTTKLQSLVFDSVDNSAAEAVQLLSQILKDSKFVSLLKNWKGDFRKGSQEASLYTIFQAHLFNNLVNTLP